MSDDNNVIQAFGKPDLPENTITIKNRNPGSSSFCRHETIELDEHRRTVLCCQCGADLDPFEFLRDNAAVLQRAWRDHKIVSQDLKGLIDRVSALKKEEARLKARVKRAREKSPAISIRGKDE